MGIDRRRSQAEAGLPVTKVEVQSDNVGMVGGTNILDDGFARDLAGGVRVAPDELGLDFRDIDLDWRNGTLRGKRLVNFEVLPPCNWKECRLRKAGRCEFSKKRIFELSREHMSHKVYRDDIENGVNPLEDDDEPCLEGGSYNPKRVSKATDKLREKESDRLEEAERIVNSDDEELTWGHDLYCVMLKGGADKVRMMLYHRYHELPVSDINLYVGMQLLPVWLDYFRVMVEYSLSGLLSETAMGVKINPLAGEKRRLQAEIRQLLKLLDGKLSSIRLFGGGGSMSRRLSNPQVVSASRHARLLSGS